MENIYRAWTDFNKTQNKILRGPQSVEILQSIEASAKKIQGRAYPNNEDWRYVRFNQLPTTQLHWIHSDAANAQVADQDFLAFSIKNFKDPQAFEKLALPRGIEIITEVEAMQPHWSLQDDNNPFFELPNTFYGLGFFIKVTKEYDKAKPIRLLFDLDQHREKDLFIQNTVHVQVEPEASADIFVDVQSEMFCGLANLCFDFKLAERSKARVYFCEQGGTQSQSMLNVNAEVGKEASFQSFDVTLPSAWSRHNLNVNLLEEGAHCQLKGAYLNDQANFVDHHTAIHHRVGHTESLEDYRGILSGEAQAVFNGKVFIAEKASKSNSEQINKNLMLSKKAEVDTKPELQIYNDDVKAAHGATVGQIDEEQRFYLQSRGYSYQAAGQILAKAFVLGLLEGEQGPIAARLKVEIEKALDRLEENQ